MYAEEYHRQPEPLEGLVPIPKQVWQSPLEVPRHWHNPPSQYTSLWNTLHTLVMISQRSGALRAYVYVQYSLLSTQRSKPGLSCLQSSSRSSQATHSTMRRYATPIRCGPLATTAATPGLFLTGQLRNDGQRQ